MYIRQKDARRYERRQRYHFLQEWLEYSGTAYHRDFLQRAKRLHIDLSKDYRVMVLMFVDHEVLSDTFEGQSLLEQMEAREMASFLFYSELTDYYLNIQKQG